MVHKVAYNARHGGFTISKELAGWMAQHGDFHSHQMLDDYQSTLRAGDGWWHGIWEGSRHDPLLILGIEELGSARSSGDGSRIQLHSLRGNRYVIQDYDGYERVDEPDDIRWISIT